MNARGELLSVMGEFMNAVADMPDDVNERYGDLIKGAKLHITFATDNIKIIKRSLSDG